MHIACYAACVAQYMVHSKNPYHTQTESGTDRELKIDLHKQVSNYDADHWQIVNSNKSQELCCDV